MCEAIKEYYDKTGNKVGFKPAGGINTVNDALIYYTIVKEILGVGGSFAFVAKEGQHFDDSGFLFQLWRFCQ